MPVKDRQHEVSYPRLESAPSINCPSHIRRTKSLSGWIHKFLRADKVRAGDRSNSFDCSRQQLQEAQGSSARSVCRSLSLHEAAEPATHPPSATTCHPQANGLPWIALPCQDKLSYRFLRTCSTPHTLASALPVFSSTINTTSVFSPQTLDNSQRSITWTLGLGCSDLSVCVKKSQKTLHPTSRPRIAFA